MPFLLCLHTVHLQSALAFAMESGATARLPWGLFQHHESFDTALLFSVRRLFSLLRADIDVLSSESSFWRLCLCLMEKLWSARCRVLSPGNAGCHPAALLTIAQWAL